MPVQRSDVRRKFSDRRLLIARGDTREHGLPHAFGCGSRVCRRSQRQRFVNLTHEDVELCPGRLVDADSLGFDGAPLGLAHRVEGVDLRFVQQSMP